MTLPTGTLTEAVQVVAETPSVIATPTVSANIRKEEVDALATPRTIQGIATLAPNVTERSPNAGQVVINGAFAWDNVFMVNGVDVNDNLFAQPQNLFIEDAIEETTVLTSGISAEYGRFSGGVVNAVTKSGGNTFSGSWRMNLLNPSWTVETPFETSSHQPRHRRGQVRHRISRQAAEHPRRHVRRPDRPRSPVVLRRRPLPEDRHADHAAGDGHQPNFERPQPAR